MAYQESRTIIVKLLEEREFYKLLEKEKIKVSICN
jgi:hypothetical protein